MQLAVFLLVSAIIICGIIYNACHKASSTFYSNDSFVLFAKIVVVLFFIFMFFQAFFNAYYFWKLDPKAELEIDNEKRIIKYSNVVDNEFKQVEVDYENIFMIRYNKAKFINLSFCEIFYKTSNAKKSIVISIALIQNLEKKIDKEIEIVKVEEVFYSDFPKTTW